MALFINGVGQDTFSMNGVSVDNLYVDGVLVWTSVLEVPRYELTEALVDASTIDDSANTASDYNGLLTESDGTTPYEPTELQYPQNGLLELASDRIMDTQYTRAERDAQYGIYGADGSTVYKIWAIQWVIANNYAVWEGDQDTPLTSTGGHNLTIPPGTMKITDERPSWLPSPVAYAPVWINFRNNASAIGLPSGILHMVEASNSWIDPIIDTQNVASNITVVYGTMAQGSGDNSGASTGNNSACICDKQLVGSSYSDSTVTIDIYLPAGTYDIQVSSCSSRSAGSAIGDYTLGSLGTVQLDGSDSAIVCDGWTGVVSAGETIQLSYLKASGSAYAHLSGLNIQRTA